MVKKTLNILRQRLSFYDNSLDGRLKLAGTAIFYTIAIAVVLFEKHQIRGDLFRVLIFGLFYSIGTLDVNNVVLPYRVRRPYTIYASKRVALKHLLFAILYGFTPQLLIFSLFDLLLIIFGTYDIAIFLLLCVVLFYLSKLTSGIGLLTSTFFILGTGFGIYYNSYYLSFLCLILGYSIVWVIISVDFFYPSSKVEVFFQGFEKLQFKPQSIFAQMLHLLHREKFIVALFVACSSFVGY